MIDVTLVDALHLLQSFARQGVQPDEAFAAVRDLQRHHPDHRLDLMWESEAFDRSVHYDLLIGVDDGATVSLSYCPDRSLPWPLRGMQRASERALLQVDGDYLTVDQAIAHLDFIWDDRRIATRLIDACIIRRELLRNPEPVTDEEIDRAIAAFRAARGLTSPEATRAWLDEHGLQVDDLRSWLADGLAASHLRRRVVSADVEPAFATNRSAYDTVRIVALEFRNADTANAFAARARLGESAFWDAIGAFDGGPVNVATQSIRRDDAGPFATAFNARVGDIVGPFDSTVALVLDKVSAELTSTVRREIEARLFDQWLAKRRAASRIEWFWGDAERTRQISAPDPAAVR